ncbi:Protein of unknown function [Pyronema omphalodes CBS 100304]|uniref:Uncharacterized protein n=1 Tax=Pyronema omphalodes (strain CBS 100304) TaxID=1076935 RepID=U4LN46_PYROM|nr:Protein of unknown function [Pyronema omphalodes CBS 100304]
MSLRSLDPQSIREHRAPLLFFERVSVSLSPAHFLHNERLTTPSSPQLLGWRSSSLYDIILFSFLSFIIPVMMPCFSPPGEAQKPGGLEARADLPISRSFQTDG